MSDLSTALGAALVAVPTAAFLAPFALAQLAAKDRFLTYIHPGNGKMIVKGEEFHSFEMSYPGHHLNRPDAVYFDPSQPRWQVLPNGDLPDSYFDNRPHWKRKFGFFDIGWPGERKVRRTKFRWKEEKGDEIDRRFAMTDIFFTKVFPYIVEQVVMTSDMYEAKLTYVVALRIVNPYLALIDKEDYLVQVMASIEEAVKNWSGEFGFAQLVSQSDGKTGAEKKRENFAAMVKELNHKLLSDPKVNPLGLVGHYGVVAETVEFRKIEPFGAEAAKYMAALFAPFLARRQAEVTVIDAEAKADAQRKVGLSEAEVTEAKLSAEARGNGLKYRLAQENLDGANIVSGGTVISVAPSVATIFKQIIEIFQGK